MVPAVAVAAVFLAEGHFYGRYALSSEAQLGLPQLGWSGVKTSFDVITGDFLSRLVLRLSAVALVLAWICVVGSCVHVIVGSTGRRTWPRRLALALPSLAAAWVVARSLLGKTYTLIKPLRDLLEQFFADTGAQQVTPLENLLSGLIVAALFFMVAGFCAVLLEEHPPDPDRLRGRYKRLQRLLYWGTVMLVVGVLHTHALIEWPAAFLLDSEAANVKRIANGHAAATGFYWSLVLVALYLPSSLLVRAEAWKLAHANLEDATVAERSEWLAKEKLSPSLTGQLSRLAAVLGPFLAGGPLTAMLSLIGG